jgi:hypothetical protein
VGTYLELLAKGSVYARLHSIQFGQPVPPKQGGAMSRSSQPETATGQTGTPQMCLWTKQIITGLMPSTVHSRKPGAAIETTAPWMAFILLSVVMDG